MNAVAELSNKIDKVEEDQCEQTAPIKDMMEQIEDMIGGLDFPMKRTIVVQNIFYVENENLQEVAEDLIHNALELPAVTIVRTEHKSRWESRAGLVKIEVGTNAHQKEILKNKRKLKKHTNDQIQTISL